MLTIEKCGELPGGVYRQYKLIWKGEKYTVKCLMNIWVGACCGFNMLSSLAEISLLDEGDFNAFLKEVSRVFKAKNYPEKMRTGELVAPPYRITQLFFLYGDTVYQRQTYKHLIAAGKEVHRYVSGSEPLHDTVMISIDL